MRRHYAGRLELPGDLVSPVSWQLRVAADAAQGIWRTMFGTCFISTWCTLIAPLSSMLCRVITVTGCAVGGLASSGLAMVRNRDLAISWVV